MSDLNFDAFFIFICAIIITSTTSMLDGLFDFCHKCTALKGITLNLNEATILDEILGQIVKKSRKLDNTRKI